MKWIKKNKIMLIAILVYIVIALVGYKALRVFFPSTEAAIYGDRLDNEVVVEQETLDGIKIRISALEFVKEVKVRKSGRIINVLVTIMDSTSKDAARSLSNYILEGFSDSQIGWYDFHLLVNKEDKNENDFPMLAYKQHNSTEFSWTKSREKVVAEEEEGK